MSDLIARLEAATGPDRELDARIALATGWMRAASPFGDTYWRGPGGQIDPRPPHFTGSVDAALTLIPPGWDVREADSNGGLWRVVLGHADDNHPKYREVWSWLGDRERGIFHRKPLAIAACIAAMKAS